MSIEFLNELEKKVDILIKNLEQLRAENAGLKGELGKKSGSSTDIEKENRALREKLRGAAERIKGLIAKIEAV